MAIGQLAVRAVGQKIKTIALAARDIPDERVGAIIDCAAQRVKSLVQRFGLMRFRSIARFIAAAIIERRTAINLAT